MEPRFLDSLTPEIRELVKRIEDYASKAILVQERPDKPKAGCLLNHHDAVICLPTLNPFPVEDVLHELLHIERNWPAKVPLLFTTNRQSESLVNVYAGYDNQLEHLVIVPQQIKYGFDATTRWNECQDKHWTGKFWEQSPHPADKRVNLLLSYLAVSILVTDADVKNKAESVLRFFGLLDEAQKFAAKIKRVIQDKPLVASAVKRFFPLADGDVQLILFDVKVGEERQIAIPKY